MKPGNMLCLHLAALCLGGEGQTGLLTVKVEGGRARSQLGAGVRACARHREKFYFFPWAHTNMLISTEETSFSFLPPMRRSQCWLPSLDGVTLPSWPLSRPASCPSLSERNSFDKALGPIWKSFSRALPNKINLKRLG